MSGFIRIDCAKAYEEICSRVGDTTRLPVEYRNGLSSLKDAGSEYNVYLGVIDVGHIDEDTVKQVIGKNGCYFIKTTVEQDLDFVWHNREKQQFEFWGPRENIHKAINVINDRIKKKEFKNSMDDAYDKFDLEDKSEKK